MAFSIYDASAPVFVRTLNNLSALLDKAVGQGFDEAALMETRLAPDMNPFPAQVRTAAFSARACVARLVGQDWPKTDDAEASFAERCSSRLVERGASLIGAVAYRNPFLKEIRTIFVRAMTGPEPRRFEGPRP